MDNRTFADRFLRLAGINILSNCMVPLASLIDTAFLGHLQTLDPLSGVALASTLFNVLFWPFGFLRMGTTGRTAQMVGQQDPDETLLTGLRNWTLALGIGLILLALHDPLQTLGFSLLQGSDLTKAAGHVYYDTRILGAPAYLLNLVSVGWFLGQEKGGIVLLLSILNNGCNVLLNYLYVVRWGLASQGAGIATAMSEGITLIVGFSLVLQVVGIPRIQAVWHRIWEPEALQTVFQLNGDILIRTLALVLTFATFTNISSALGSDILVTNTLIMQVVTLAAYSIDGFAFATESLAGFFFGTGNFLKLKQLVVLSGSVSLISGLGFAAIFTLFPGRLFQILTDQALILDQIREYVSWLIPVLGFGSLAYLLDGYFLGLTRGRILRNASVLSSLIGFGPMASLAWIREDPHLLWLAMVSYMATRMISLGCKIPQTLKSP